MMLLPVALEPDSVSLLQAQGFHVSSPRTALELLEYPPGQLAALDLVVIGATPEAVRLCQHVLGSDPDVGVLLLPGEGEFERRLEQLSFVPAAAERVEVTRPEWLSDQAAAQARKTRQRRHHRQLLEKASLGRTGQGESLASLLESVPMGLLLLDEDLRLRAWNGVAKRLLGPIEPGAGFLELFPSRLRPGLGSFLRDQASSTEPARWVVMGNSHPALELIARKLEDEQVLLLLQDGGTVSEAKGPGEQELKAACEHLSREVETARKTQERLRSRAAGAQRTSDELSRFVAAMAHDVKEPLRAVVAYLELLERHSSQLDERGREFLRFAHQGATRVQRLVVDLLSLITLGSQTTMGFVDLERCLEEALENLRLLLEEKGAVLKRQRLPRVFGNARELTQCLQNLIANAAHYSSVPARIEVGADREDQGWTIWVRDHGAGIAPEDLERIFEAFERLGTPPAADGSGLGLAICKRIVEKHGGRIWAESEIGKGSGFFMSFRSLPVGQAEAHPESGEHAGDG
ncbi:MAG: PAS domain-containing protein [Armatimonadetes bacterium]|nr:PAS domain-containing protein [Armatimonadota bacterium]